MHDTKPLLNLSIIHPIATDEAKKTTTGHAKCPATIFNIPLAHKHPARHSKCTANAKGRGRPSRLHFRISNASTASRADALQRGPTNGRSHSAATRLGLEPTNTGPTAVPQQRRHGTKVAGIKRERKDKHEKREGKMKERRRRAGRGHRTGGEREAAGENTCDTQARKS